MDRIARVARGPDRGDYRPVATEYGSTYWHMVGSPREIPRTSRTMEAWLTSGKAILVEPPAPNADLVVDLAQPREVDAVDLTDLDPGESNFMAEVFGWSRIKRLETLRRCGVPAEDHWDLQRCAREFVALRRQQHGRRRVKPAPKPQAAPAPPAPTLDTTALRLVSRGTVTARGATVETWVFEKSREAH